MAQMMLGQREERKLDVDYVDDISRVPLDNVARLMYYLHCVCRVLPAEVRNAMPSRLTTFAEFYKLTDGEKRAVVMLAEKLNPDKLPFVIEVPILPDHKPNLFVKFSSVEETVTALGIQVGGGAMMALKREVGNKQELIQVMAYTPAWILTYYKNPLKELKRICTIL